MTETGRGGPAPAHIQRRPLRRAHERWAGSYDSRAVLAERTRAELLSRLDFVTLAPRAVLDAGAGTGAGALALGRRYRRARVVAVDHALAMCRLARRRRTLRVRFDVLQADLAALPLRDGAVDMVFSNLALQDCDPLDGTLREIRRVTADGGLFCFASLGPDSLRELRAAWQAVDEFEHVHPFVDMHDLGEALMRNGFREPVLDVERYVLTYPAWEGLLAELRGLGGASALAGRRTTFTGRRRLAALAAAYEGWRRDGVLPATFEVVFGHAWAVGGAPPAAAGGEVRIAPGAIGRTGRRAPGAADG